MRQKGSARDQAVHIVNLTREQSLVTDGRLSDRFCSRLPGIVDGLYLRYYDRRAPAPATSTSPTPTPPPADEGDSP